MTFTLVIKDNVTITRLRQCTAMQQREKVQSVLRDILPPILQPRLGVICFNNPKGTLEIPIGTKQNITEDAFKRYTTGLHTGLENALTPVRPVPYASTWRPRPQ